MGLATLPLLPPSPRPPANRQSKGYAYEFALQSLLHFLENYRCIGLWRRKFLLYQLSFHLGGWLLGCQCSPASSILESGSSASRGGSSSRPSAYRVSNEEEEQRKKYLPGNDHMVLYSSIPSLDSCKSASTCSGTCSTLLSQTFLMMICIRRSQGNKGLIERGLRILYLFRLRTFKVLPGAFECTLSKSKPVR